MREANLAYSSSAAPCSRLAKPRMRAASPARVADRMFSTVSLGTTFGKGARLSAVPARSVPEPGRAVAGEVPVEGRRRRAEGLGEGRLPPARLPGPLPELE